MSQAVASRFSCREFLPDKVPDLAVVHGLLGKAAQAASDGNCQPWRVYVLTGDARDAVVKEVQSNSKNAVSEFHNYPDQPASAGIVYDSQELTDKTNERMAQFKRTVYGNRRKRCGDMLYNAIGVPKSDLPGKLKQLAKNADFFGAPVGLIITVDRMFDRAGWGNVGMFLATFALLCEEAGLSTCFQGFFGIHHQAVRNVVKQIDEDQVVWCGVALGYANRDHPINQWRTERAATDDFAVFVQSKM